MKLHRFLLLTIAGLIIAGIYSAPARAAGIMYSNHRKMINAGVAVLKNYDPNTGAITGTRANSYPYLFYIMDRRGDIKPRGWEFINPLASPLSHKTETRYWELDLDQTTLANLSKLDVLYICAQSSTADPLEFPMGVRDKLLQFVDAGGVLWIDNPAPNSAAGLTFTTNAANAFFITQPGNVVSGGYSYPMIYERHHPLLTSPYWLTEMDVASMGADANRSGQVKCYLDPTANPPALPTVVALGTNVNQGYVNAMEYGSGKIVITAGGVGGAIQPGSFNPNVTDFELQMLSRASALKMAYNVVNWATSYNGFRKNARHSGYVSEGISTGNTEKWRLDIPPSDYAESSIAIHKNVFFYTGMNGSTYTLYALDGAPEEDLDSDGNPDDGALDDPAGTNADIIWSAALPGKCSSPVACAIKMPIGSGNSQTVELVECVIVQCAADDGSMQVLVYRAFPVDGTNPRKIGSNADLLATYNLPNGSGAATAPTINKVFAPTFYNNRIYASGGDGRVFCMDPNLSTSSYVWVMPYIASNNSPYGYQPIIGSPTIGFIEHRSTGALVSTLFVVSQGTPGLNQNDFIMGLPLYVSGERLTQRDPSSRLTFITECSLASSGVTGSQIHVQDTATDIVVKDSSGNVVNGYSCLVNQMETNGTYSFAAGKMVIKMSDGSPIPESWQVFANYELDYSAMTPPMDLHPVLYYQMPPQLVTTATPNLCKAVGTSAMGADGMLFMAARQAPASSNPNLASGLLYAFQHNGDRSRTSISARWQYKLYNWDISKIPYSTTPVGSTGISPAYAFLDRWALLDPASTSAAPLPLDYLQFKSSPVATRDKVFATASRADISGLNPGYSAKVAGGALLCFKAKSDFVIRVNQSSSTAAFVDTTTGSRRSIRLWQPDPHQDWGNPLFEACGVPPSMIDYDRGTITINDFGNSMLVVRNQLVGGAMTMAPPAPINPALPIWVVVNNVVIPPDQVDVSSWDNLLWYFVPAPHEDSTGTKTPCTGIDSPPTVIGDKVYFICNDGYLYCLNASPGLSPHKRIDSTDKSNVLINGQQVSKTKATGDQWSTVSASNGLIGLITPEGVKGYDNPITLIADSYRALELDGSCDPTWACDALLHKEDIPGTTSGGEPMVGGKKQPLNRPARIKSFGPSDYLVVDSGDDQVARMSRSGEVIISVSNFTDNFKHMLKSGEPKELRGPMDAMLWTEWEKDTDGTTPIYVHHWLIADTGNHRVVDLVFRFAQDGKRIVRDDTGNDVAADATAPPELNWISLSMDLGRKYRFNSAQLIGDSNGYQIWVAASNWMVDEKSYGAPGGAILKFNYRTGTAGSWTYQPGEVAAQADSFVIGTGTTQYKISNPKYLRVVTKVENSTVVTRALLCESRGVFMLDPSGNTLSATDGVTNGGWGGFINYQTLPRDILNVDTKGTPDPSDDTESIIRAPYGLPELGRLDAVHVQLLPSGNLLITNSHSDNDPAGHKFNGEVVEVCPNGANSYIQWYAPQIKRTDSNTDSDIQKMIGTYNLTQPMSAERIF